MLWNFHFNVELDKKKEWLVKILRSTKKIHKLHVEGCEKIEAASCITEPTTRVISSMARSRRSATILLS